MKLLTQHIVIWRDIYSKEKVSQQKKHTPHFLIEYSENISSKQIFEMHEIKPSIGALPWFLSSDSASKE